MVHLLFFLLLPFLLFSQSLRVASYNVENLFDMHHDKSEYAAYIPYKHNWIPTILNKKLTHIAEVICETDATIIGLQEIENLNALKLLQQHLKRYGCSYPYRAITHTPQSAIQVALLSRLPIEYAKDLVVTHARGIRNILEVKFRLEGEDLIIFVNHWNSKRAPNAKRLRSAKRLKRRLDQLSSGVSYLLMGDFNLNYNDPILLDTLEAGRVFVKQNYNLWFEFPIYRRWSHNFYGNKQALDAIIVGSALVDGKGLEYLKDSFYVLKKPYLFHKKGYILRWSYQQGRHRGIGYSDHLPVVATLTTKVPFREEQTILKKGKIKQLLNPASLSLPLYLESVKVIKRSKEKVTIAQEGFEIPIYGIDQPLKLGRVYDLIVYKRQLYQGSYEVVDFSIENSYDTTQKRRQDVGKLLQ